MQHPYRKQVFLWRRTELGMITFEAIKSQQGNSADQVQKNKR
jgi:hypothetical protein